jgi:C1A family cysteine protease
MDGIVPMVPVGDSLLGGHAVLVVGYSQAKGFIVRNSWGEGWGSGGYCFWAQEYLSNVFDAWTTA